MTAGNLQEIYSACRCADPKQSSLIPSLITSSVYHECYGWGRLWKWFYQSVQFLTGKDLKTARLVNVLQKTTEIFSVKLKEAVAHATRYRCYLEKKINEEEVDENETHQFRKRISLWTRSSAPLAAFADCHPHQIKELIHCKDTKKVPFSYKKNTRLLNEVQLFIDLEGYLHQPLPLALLKRIAHGLELTADETNKAERWIEKLNQNKRHIPLNLFLGCLQTLVEMPSFGGKLITLHMFLVQHGLELLHMADQEHLQWASTLQPGDTLTCGGITYRLGKRIDSGKGLIDFNFIFAIENDRDQMIAIGNNCAYLPIKQQIAEKHQWGIPMPTMRSVSQDGRFAVVEKVKTFTLREGNTVTSIVRLFQWWNEHSLCPTKLDVDSLMLNSKGDLKYTLILEPKPFDFRILEDIAYAVSRGNLSTYLSLIKLARLDNHEVLGFYRRIVECALENKPLNIRQLAATRDITDPKTVGRGRVLYREMQRLQKKIIHTLCLEFRHIPPQSLEKSVNKQLISQYKETCSASHIWPEVEETTTNHLQALLRQDQ